MGFSHCSYIQNQDDELHSLSWFFFYVASFETMTMIVAFVIVVFFYCLAWKTKMTNATHTPGFFVCCMFWNHNDECHTRRRGFFFYRSTYETRTMNCACCPGLFLCCKLWNHYDVFLCSSSWFCFYCSTSKPMTISVACHLGF